MKKVIISKNVKGKWTNKEGEEKEINLTLQFWEYFIISALMNEEREITVLCNDNFKFIMDNFEKRWADSLPVFEIKKGRIETINPKTNVRFECNEYKIKKSSLLT